MALREKLEEDIKTSMRSHDQARLDALRFFKNAVLAVEKEQKKELDDAGMIEVATKQASDRRDSVKAFEKAEGTQWPPRSLRSWLYWRNSCRPRCPPKRSGK